MSRRGDDGNTVLIGGRRVPKDDARVEAQGALDELNARIGVARCTTMPGEVDAVLSRLQSELLDLVAEVGTPRENNPRAEHVAPFPMTALEALERDLRDLEARLPPLTTVILPGGHHAAAQIHLCRSACRRAERRVVAVARHERVPGVVLKYLNGLSELFFVMARLVNVHNCVQEPEWISRERRTPPGP